MYYFRGIDNLIAVFMYIYHFIRDQEWIICILSKESLAELNKTDCHVSRQQSETLLYIYIYV